MGVKTLAAPWSECPELIQQSAVQYLRMYLAHYYASQLNKLLFLVSAMKAFQGCKRLAAVYVLSL